MASRYPRRVKLEPGIKSEPGVPQVRVKLEPGSSPMSLKSDTSEQPHTRFRKKARPTKRLKIEDMLVEEDEEEDDDDEDDDDEETSEEEEEEEEDAPPADAEALASSDVVESVEDVLSCTPRKGAPPCAADGCDVKEEDAEACDGVKKEDAGDAAPAAAPPEGIHTPDAEPRAASGFLSSDAKAAERQERQRRMEAILKAQGGSFFG